MNEVAVYSAIMWFMSGVVWPMGKYLGLINISWFSCLIPLMITSVLHSILFFVLLYFVLRFADLIDRGVEKI